MWEMEYHKVFGHVWGSLPMVFTHDYITHDNHRWTASIMARRNNFSCKHNIMRLIFCLSCLIFDFWHMHFIQWWFDYISHIFDLSTLGHHQGRRVLSSVIACGCLSFHLSVSPSVHLSVLNDIPAPTLYGFQLSAKIMVGWCTVPWSRSLSKMAMLRQFLHIPRNFEIFHDRLFWPGLRDDVSAPTLKGFQVSDTNSVGWCIVTWSRSLFKMAMLIKVNEECHSIQASEITDNMICLFNRLRRLTKFFVTMSGCYVSEPDWACPHQC